MNKTTINYANETNKYANGTSESFMMTKHFINATYKPAAATAATILKQVSK